MVTLEETLTVFAKLVNEISYSEFTTACEKAGFGPEEMQQILEVLDEVGN